MLFFVTVLFTLSGSKGPFQPPPEWLHAISTDEVLMELQTLVDNVEATLGTFSIRREKNPLYCMDGTTHRCNITFSGLRSSAERCFS
jgi:hypothetical protein